jgi:hypothetical protein
VSHGGEPGERSNSVILPAVRRILTILLAATAAGSLVGGTSAVATRPALRLLDEAPLTLGGTGFRANEHVKVVAVVGSRSVRWVTAGSGGRFGVRFRGLGANECRGLTVTAIGDRGSRAAYRRPPGVCPAP